MYSVMNPDMTFDLRIPVLIKAEYKYYARASDREPQRRRAKTCNRSSMSCGCYCCRKPRYKRLVDALYPEDPQDTTPVASNLDKLLYFASSSPEHLDRVGDYLAFRLRRSLNRDRRGYVACATAVTSLR